jgi:hypothetical protein
MASPTVTERPEPSGDEKGNHVYVGPRPFRTGETLYCRDRETSELVSLLVSQRLVLLHSPSGAGKTSLIQANLVPAVRADDFEVPMSPPEDAPKPQPVIIRLNRQPQPTDPPGANRYLLSALLSLEMHRPEGQRRTPAGLAGMSMGRYLEEEFPAASSPAGAGFRPLLLLFDQFEEFLILDPTDEPAKWAFARQLGEALANPGRWSLFAIREDHLGALEPYLYAIPTRLTASYRLDLLRAEEARVAVIEPARAAGVEFEAGVVDDLVKDLRQVRVQQPSGAFQLMDGPYVAPVQFTGRLPVAVEDPA